MRKVREGKKEGRRKGASKGEREKQKASITEPQKSLGIMPLDTRV